MFAYCMCVESTVHELCFHHIQSLPDCEDTLKVLRNTFNCILVQLYKAGRHLHKKRRKKKNTYATKDTEANQNNGVCKKILVWKTQQGSARDRNRLQFGLVTSK